MQKQTDVKNVKSAETGQKKSNHSIKDGQSAGVEILTAEALLRQLVFAALGSLFCSARLFFGARPLGLALVGAAGSYWPGATAGVVFFCMLDEDYHTLGGLVLLLGLRLLLSLLQRRETPSVRLFGERRLFRIAAVGFSTFAVGILQLVSGGYLYYDLFGVLMATLVAPLATALYLGATEEGEPLFAEGQHVGVATLVLTGIFALREFSFFGIAPGAAAAALVAFWLAARRGMLWGAAGGLICGLCYDPSLSPAFLLCGLAFGLLEKSSRGGGILCGGAAGAAYAFLIGKGDGLVALLPALFSAGALFLAGDSAGLIEGAPARQQAVARRRAAEQSAAAACAAESRAERKRIEGALLDLSGSLFELAGRTRRPGTEAMSRMVEQCLSQACLNCPKNCACRPAGNGISTLTVSNFCRFLRQNSMVGRDDIPKLLGEDCVQSDQIAERINRGSLALAEDALRGDGTGIIAGDYAVIGKLLAEMESGEQAALSIDAAVGERLMQQLQRSGYQLESAVLCGRGRRQVILRGVRLPGRHIKMRELRRIIEKTCRFSIGEPQVTDADGLTDIVFGQAVRMHAISFKRTRSGPKGEKYCGDSTVLLKTVGGDAQSLLCDGMGSGKEAALVSTLSTVFLGRLLQTEILPETAFTMLNGLLAARAGRGTESSTTVDLLAVDGMKGEGRLYKCGAAPTYLLRGGEVSCFAARTAPLGILETPDIECITLPLCPGDLLLQVSDGFTGGDEECAWLVDMLREEWDGDAENFTRLAMNRAGKQSEDDLSIILTLIKEGAEKSDRPA